MLPQRLAAARPRATAQAERERDQNSRHPFDEARRQEYEQRSQRDEQGGGEGSAVTLAPARATGTRRGGSGV